MLLHADLKSASPNGFAKTPIFTPFGNTIIFDGGRRGDQQVAPTPRVISAIISSTIPKIGPGTAVNRGKPTICSKRSPRAGHLRLVDSGMTRKGRTHATSESLARIKRKKLKIFSFPARENRQNSGHGTMISGGDGDAGAKVRACGDLPCLTARRCVYSGLQKCR